MGMMYGLCVWVQYIQGTTTTPLTIKHPEGGTGLPQSIVKVIRFLRLWFQMKAGVKRPWEGCTGCARGSNPCKGQLQHY
jgi:hypothetical protein